MSKKEEKVYIVTNSTLTGDYTPYVTKSEEDARDWLYECSINNFISSRAPYLVKIGGNTFESYDEIKDAGLIEEMKEIINKSGSSEIDDNSSYIEYGDDSFNRMHIFEAYL